MNRNHTEIYKNLAAFTLFILFIAVILFIIRGAVSTWTYAAMVITVGILIAVFAYRTMISCARFKNNGANERDVKRKYTNLGVKIIPPS